MKSIDSNKSVFTQITLCTLKKNIGVLSVYKIVLISGVEQSKSVVIHISITF